MCIKPISLGRNADTDDAANRLISQVMPPLQSGSGARVLSYLYRYDDLLHQKVGPRGTETLTWDGADPLFWQRSQDGLFQLVVHGNSAIRSVGTGSGGGGALANHLHLDAQANVQATTDAAHAISQDVAWDLFGDVTLGQSPSNPLDYGGGMGYWNDYDTPPTYVRQRWLDPNTGRWLSRDPVETEHPYAYAGSNPMLYADPGGTQSQDVDLMGHPLHGRRKKHHPDNDLMAPPHAVSGRQTQAPHLADIDWSIVLWEGAKKLALGVGVAAVFGFAFATAPAWVSGALVVGGTVLLSAAVISAVHERLNGAKSMHEPLSIPLRIVAGVGDVVGVTPILEGAAGYEFFTGRQFNTQERSEKLSEWGTTASFLLGPRAFNVGEQSGYLVRQPRLLSGGISGLPNAWQKAGTAQNVARVIRIHPARTEMLASAQADAISAIREAQYKSRMGLAQADVQQWVAQIIKGLSKYPKGIPAQELDSAMKEGIRPLPKTRGGKFARMVSSAINLKRPFVYRGSSGHLSYDDLAPEMKQIVQEAMLKLKAKGWEINADGRIPGRPREYPLWNCAEIDAVNQALKKGAKFTDIEVHCVSIFRQSLSWEQAEACCNCIELLHARGVRITSGLSDEPFDTPPGHSAH